MSGISYSRYELLRTFRNRRFYLFALGVPLVFYWLLAAPQQNDHNFAKSGLSVPLYYMVGLAGFGSMVSMLSAGGRIAGERQVGWTRQLRISPLSVRSYFRAKVVTAYAMALLTLALLYVSGAVLGVSLSAQRWLTMTGLILVGLMPFAALGILIGHLVSTDSVGPATGGGVSILAFLGGTWFPHPIRVPAVGPSGAGGEDCGPRSDRDPAAGAPPVPIERDVAGLNEPPRGQELSDLE
jgi:ABC-2 type transport system permease protein